MKADRKTKQRAEAEPANLRQQLAAANRRIAEMEAVEDRRKSAAALADTHEQIELIVDTLPVLLAYIDAEQHYLYANRLYADWYGLAREEIIGKHVRDVLHETTYQKALPVIEAALRGQRITYENDAAYDVQGQLHTVWATYVPHLDENGRAKAFLAMVEDITERKWAEERVKHLNAVLHAIRNVNQLITREKDRDRLLDDACRILMESRGYFNAWIALIGPRGELQATFEAGLGNEFLPLAEQMKRGRLPNCARRALDKPGVVVFATPPADCRDCPLAGRYHESAGMSARLEHEGKVYGLLTASVPSMVIGEKEEQALFYELAIDLAFALHAIEVEEEQRRAEEALRESEEKYRLLFENMMNGFALHEIVVDEKGKPVDYVFLEVNSAFERLTGLRRDGLIGRKVTEVIPGTEKDHADWIGQYGQVALTGQETRFVQHSQPLGRWYSVLAFSPRKGQFATIFEDFTERKRAEAQLAEQLDELRRWHKATLGREARILDLKREVNELLAQAGQPPRYPSAEAEGQ